MTWGEFKKWVEERGVKDDDEIWYIDISDSHDMTLEKDEKMGVSIG